uniref:Concentrative nucleoside transporter C-terminal domain-containing protein n=1 Tax=Timema douglasi TaxID=61478 RepID=A0A7R8VWI0_TIMDO|nr:unnamed protein product [Timema douglasi]
MGYIFIPLAWVMGVEWEQCQDVAKLVGLKTMVNEFVAYQELGVLKRAEAIATYALCGFSNPGSLGILIGSLTSLCPSQRPIITEVAFRAFIAGSAVCFMTACIAAVELNTTSALANYTTEAGILLTEDQYTNNETNTTILP